MPTIVNYILPIVVLLATIIVLGRICYATSKYSTAHYMRKGEFWSHTVVPLLVFGILNMLILIGGGILQLVSWYDIVRLSVLEPLRAAFPITISICTTMFGLLVVFAILYPKLSIYPQVAYTSEGNKHWYAFMVQNVGLWEIYEMQAQLYTFIEDENNLGHKHVTPVKLDITSNYPVLAWRFGHENQNSILIETKNNTLNKKKIHESNAQFELHVKVMHPISRIIKEYTHTFALTDIHYGGFKNCRLYRYNAKEGNMLSELLPKEIRWRVSNILRQVEILLLVVWVFGVCGYIMHTPCDESCICMAEWGYYWASLIIALVEIARQIARCPIRGKKVDSNI